MKIKITYLDASEEDCRRTDYVTYVNGKEFCLAASALGKEFTEREVERNARKLFGDDVEIEY